MMLTVLSALLLGAMLWIARARDRARGLQLETQLAGVLTGDAHELLDYLAVPLKGTQLVSDMCRDASDGRDVRSLRIATKLGKVLVPEARSGFRVLVRLSRTVAAVVDVAPVRPLLWRAWQLRGLAGVAYVVHQVLVTGAERIRLRLWLLGESFRFCLRSLRRGALTVVKDPEAWAGVRAAAADLSAATAEAQLTHEQLIRSLDVVGALEPKRRERLTRASG